MNDEKSASDDVVKGEGPLPTQLPEVLEWLLGECEMTDEYDAETVLDSVASMIRQTITRTAPVPGVLEVELNLDHAVSLVQACDFTSNEPAAVAQRAHQALLIAHELYAGLRRIGRVKGPLAPFAKDAELQRLATTEQALASTALVAQLKAKLTELQGALPGWRSLLQRWNDGEIILGDALVEARGLSPMDRQRLVEGIQFRGVANGSQSERLLQALMREPPEMLAARAVESLTPWTQYHEQGKGSAEDESLCDCDPVEVRALHPEQRCEVCGKLLGHS